MRTARSVRAAPAEADVILDVRDLAVAYGAKGGRRCRLPDLAWRDLRAPRPERRRQDEHAQRDRGADQAEAGTVLLDGSTSDAIPRRRRRRMGVQLQATSFQSQLTIKQIVRLYAGLYGVRLSDPRSPTAAARSGSRARRPSRSSSSRGDSSNGCAVRRRHPRAGLAPARRADGRSRPPVAPPALGPDRDIRQQGGSIILTTHSMEEAQAVCDRVAIIDHGRLLTTETPQRPDREAPGRPPSSRRSPTAT